MLEFSNTVANNIFDFLLPVQQLRLNDSISELQNLLKAQLANNSQKDDNLGSRPNSSSSYKEKKEAGKDKNSDIFLTSFDHWLELATLKDNVMMMLMSFTAFSSHQSKSSLQVQRTADKYPWFPVKKDDANGRTVFMNIVVKNVCYLLGISVKISRRRTVKAVLEWMNNMTEAKKYYLMHFLFPLPLVPFALPFSSHYKIIDLVVKIFNQVPELYNH
ncbi:hypothetical protein QOT17_004530 [Balamuthia mandrillaris]